MFGGAKPHVRGAGTRTPGRYVEVRATPMRSSRPSMLAGSPSPCSVVDDLHGERLAGDVRLERAGDVEQRRVAAQRERDAVLDGQAGRLARVLDRVDDLLREALAAQPLVERELQRDGVRALPLELVALQRRQRHDEVLAP